MLKKEIALTFVVIAFGYLAITMTISKAFADDKPEAKEEANFIRVTRNDKNEITGLYTPIIRYIKGDGEKQVTLDIFGAVHIADPNYYETLNVVFGNYDAVLYELVAPDEQLVPSRNRESTIADLAGTFLHLQHQLHGIDYSAKNFVHADFTRSELKEAMAKNGDNAFTLAGSFLIEMIRTQNKAAYEAKKSGKTPTVKMPEIDLMALLSGDPNQSVKLKRMMAEQLSKGDEANFGAVISDYLVNKRNNDALGVMDVEIKKGKKNLALFYGAAHIPDFDKKLKEKGFVRKETKWIPAWKNLKITNNQTQDMQDMLKLFQKFQPQN